MYKVISVDQEKEHIPGYNPKEASNVHRLSAKNADQKLIKSLKDLKNKNIILMCGGSASGKTEFIDEYCLSNEISDLEGIIFDSTLWSINGARIKIRNIKRFGNKPIINFILPYDVKRCFYIFNERERKIPQDRFYETHSGAREVILWIAKNYPEIEIAVFYSYSFGEIEEKPLLLDRNTLELGGFEEILFDDRDEMIEFFQSKQLSVKDIKNIISEF